MNEPKYKIWGKSVRKENDEQEGISLFQHTKDVLDTFDSLANKLNGILEKYLQDCIKLVIKLHDIGKVLPAFQIKSLKNKNYQPWNITEEIDHSLFSVFWINRKKLSEKIREIVKEKSEIDIEYIVDFIYSTVAFHHWHERFQDLISANDYKMVKLAEWLTNNKDKAELLKNNIINEFKDVDEISELIELNIHWLNGIINGIALADYVIPPYQLYYLPKRILIPQEHLKQWILLSGFPMTADHFASFQEIEGSTDFFDIEINGPGFDAIKNKISKHLKKKLDTEYDENKIWQFKKVEKFKEDNAILMAPTGKGKTEFAWLWSNGNKFFYTLPLRSAVNQIYERTRIIFDDSDENEKVGLLHSDADVFLLGDGCETDNMKVYDFARHLSYPAIISTGDQFFPYALRPPGYERIFARFSYSRLIIDEVQAYDPKQAAIVVKFIEDINQMGGKFLFMTATLPEFINDELKVRIDGWENDEIIKDKTLNIFTEERTNLERIKKHKIQFKFIENLLTGKKPDFNIDKDYLKEILTNAVDKRVLVILNTVFQAQQVYKNLKELAEMEFPSLIEKIDLLHSRFTLNKRKNIENNIVNKAFSNPKPENENGGRILVASQVIEASLDIDADIMFTEMAPIDALIQRMGRVLRRIRSEINVNYESNESNVIIWVFKHGIESGNGRVYENELLALSLELLMDFPDLNKDYKKWISNKELKYLTTTKKLLEEKTDKEKQKKDIKDDSPIFIDETPKPISEYDKYELVKKMYESISEEGYLKTFYQVLDILDAGYFSDRKTEAQKIFREINDISIIPMGKAEESIQSLATKIIEFCNKISVNEKRLFSRFKKEILSEYVINIPLYQVKDEIVEWNLTFNRIKEYLQDKNIEKRWLYRLEMWLKGIYFVSGEEKDGEFLKDKSNLINQIL